MKRTTTAVNSLAIAIATVLVLGNAPTAQAAEKGCSNASLKGTFGYTFTGVTLAPPQIAGPIAQVGTQTFDGDGNTSAKATTSLNGSIFVVTIKGTYKVNSDCTGSWTLITSTGVTIHSDFVIDDSGAELRAINTDPGGIGTFTGHRQFPNGDWRE